MIYFATCNDQWFHIGLLALGRDPYLKPKDLKGNSPLPVRYIGFAEGGRRELRQLRAFFSAELKAPGEGWMPYTSFAHEWLRANTLRKMKRTLCAGIPGADRPAVGSVARANWVLFLCRASRFFYIPSDRCDENQGLATRSRAHAPARVYDRGACDTPLCKGQSLVNMRSRSRGTFT
jgi:hypothetical protein